MSTGRPRRLDSVTRRHDAAVAARLEARAWERERKKRVKEELKKRAAIAMVEVAQALAGTVMRPSGNAPVYEPPPRLAPAVKRPPAPRPRPDQHTEVTWDEAMSVPWITPDRSAPYGAIMVEQSARKPCPKGCIDPWPGQDCLIPSYASKPDEEE